MIPPFERKGAGARTRHHLLFERPTWSRYDRSNRVRNLGSYIIGAGRAEHDYLHWTIKTVPVPGPKVLEVMFEIGKEYTNWKDDANRMEAMLENMVDFSRTTPSAEQSHEMAVIAVSIQAQMNTLATAGLMRTK